MDSDFIFWVLLLVVWAIISILLCYSAYKSGQESTLVAIQNFFDRYGADRLVALFENEPYVDEVIKEGEKDG